MADALLSPTVGLAFDAGAALLVAGAARRLPKDPDHARKVPLMGVLGAFVFAAQMVNFAIPSTGSSGHLAGGLLLAILLGPNAALLVLASVLAVQALFFADGGLLALGCNLFNMGVWPALFGAAVYRRLAGRDPAGRRLTAACVVAAAISAELGALGVLVQTGLSGRVELPAGRFAALLLGIHLPIGIVEGLVTAAMLRFARRFAPERIAGVAAPSLPFVPAVLALALFLGCVGAWFASARPDGLEWSLARSRAVAPAVVPATAGPAHTEGIVRLDASLTGALGISATLALAGGIGWAACARRSRVPPGGGLEG